MAEAVSSGANGGRLRCFTVPAIMLAGSASGWLSNSGYGNDWFDALAKPSFMPPGWAFGVVWPILYFLLGVAVALILAEPHVETAPQRADPLLRAARAEFRLVADLLRRPCHPAGAGGDRRDGRPGRARRGPVPPDPPASRAI